MNCQIPLTLNLPSSALKHSFVASDALWRLSTRSKTSLLLSYTSDEYRRELLKLRKLLTRSLRQRVAPVEQLLDRMSVDRVSRMRRKIKERRQQQIRKL